MKETISAKDVVALLNDILEKDPDAVKDLVLKRVRCNKKIAYHATVQVEKYGENKYTVGLLGVLNGLFGKNEKGFGCIQVVLNKGIEKFVYNPEAGI